MTKSKQFCPVPIIISAASS